jgi:hypothetical protein
VPNGFTGGNSATKPTKARSRKFETVSMSRPK